MSLLAPKLPLTPISIMVGPNQEDWHRKDQFGLPAVPPSLLAETPEDRRARIELIEQLVHDLYRSVATHLGRNEARRLFKGATKRPRGGNRPRHCERNREWLKLYDRELAKGTNKRRAIPERVASKICRDHHELREESVARQIRRLVKERKRRQEAMEEQCRHFLPSLLGTA